MTRRPLLIASPLWASGIQLTQSCGNTPIHKPKGIGKNYKDAVQQTSSRTECAKAGGSAARSRRRNEARAILPTGRPRRVPVDPLCLLSTRLHTVMKQATLPPQGAKCAHPQALTTGHDGRLSRRGRGGQNLRSLAV